MHHPYFTWTNNADAVTAVYTPRRHRRRGVVRLLLALLLPSLPNLT